MAVEDVDLIVIGSGQGGVPLAVHFAKQGKHVVLFERGKLGGTCVNYGCTPSKAFLASAHNAGRARDAAGVGVHCTVSIDGEAVMRRVNRIRGEWHDGVREKLNVAGIRLVQGDAKFTGVREVEGGGVKVRAPLVVIDTGSRPSVPPIDGLAGTPYLTNETFFDITTIPESLIVLGGGYVGLELGQGCARLGSRVDIIERTGQILSNEEPDTANVLKDALESDGVRIHLAVNVTSVAYNDGFTVRLNDGTELTAKALLVAAGRTPNSQSLSARASGIELDDKGYVRTDEHLQTACKGVFALGEAAHQPAFTHVAWEDYRRVLDVMNGGSRTRDDRPLAYSTFTEPQVARVGLSLPQARKAGYDARTAQLELADTARGAEWNLPRGFYRIVVDRASEKILGATLVGYEAGEIVHAIYAHMMNGATWHVLEQSVHIHPTFSEALPTTVRQLVPSA